MATMNHIRDHWRMVLGLVALLLISAHETASLLHITRWSELLQPGAALAILGSIGVTLKAWLTPTHHKVTDPEQ